MTDKDRKAENADKRPRSLNEMMFSNVEKHIPEPEPEPEPVPVIVIQEEKPKEKSYSEIEVQKIVDEQRQVLVEEMENQKPKKDSEWKTFQKLGMNMPDVLETDYEHKAWLLTSKFIDKPLIKLHDLAMKELRLANLPDTELALIYAFKMDCVEDWLSVGYGDLAKQRLMHMLFRLGLSVSVDAKELTLQHGQSNVSMTLPMGEQSYSGLPEEDETTSRPKINIRKFLGRFKS